MDIYCKKVCYYEREGVTNMAQHKIYSFYAELLDYNPKIWRRFQINGSKTMANLGYTLMVMFEMQASHLFCIEYDAGAAFMKDMLTHHSKEDIERMLSKNGYDDWKKPYRFELPFEDAEQFEDYKYYDAGKITLNRFSDKIGMELMFNYDYGDDWRVKIVLENCEKQEIHAGELPRVLQGEGYGIIEDCGGTGGLEEIAKAYKKKKGSQYNEYREWLGIDDLDLAAFDIDDMNYRLKKVPRIYCDCYEYGLEPTKQSIDLLTRKYKKG